jgi:hypothetical protein
MKVPHYATFAAPNYEYFSILVKMFCSITHSQTPAIYKYVYITQQIL